MCTAPTLTVIFAIWLQLQRPAHAQHPILPLGLRANRKTALPALIKLGQKRRTKNPSPLCVGPRGAVDIRINC